MSKVRMRKPGERPRASRRQYTPEFREEAVRMVLDGHSVSSVCERLGVSTPSLLYKWKRQLVEQGGTTAVGLEARVRELEAELRRVEQERDILKKALGIFGRGG
jgi:transposase